MAVKKILVLGSGMVAKPCVNYLLRDPNNTLTIASRTLSSAEQLANGHPNTSAVCLDVAAAPPELESAIADHDVVISLVPFMHHATVARLAIGVKTQVVTTSYVSPAIKDLDEMAKAAGVTILNEVGADPGVDHLYAIKTINEVHAKGGKIREFYSYCGGLAAPESANNPLRSKFSWSPRGALMSQNNSATFLKDGEVVEIPNKDLMAAAEPYHILDGYSFLAYPNRNSVPFRDFYQIPEAHTVIRGSLRYEGNPAMVKALIDLGWLDPAAKDWLVPGQTWAQIQQKATGATAEDEQSLIARVDELCKFPDSQVRVAVLDGLRWIGLFSRDEVAVHSNLLDTLSARLGDLCRFEEGERDLLILQHKFGVEWEDGTKDTITSTLEMLGDPHGYSAMAKAVGIHCGIATQMLLDGHPAIAKPGVVAPYTKNICDVLREKVELEGITLVEKSSRDQIHR